MPHKVEGEGHFAALLTKKGELPDKRNKPVYTIASTEQKNLKVMISLWDTFAGETLCPDTVKRLTQNRRYTAFGDNLYLVPDILPGLKGLKVIRPGLQLGSIKKDRFEPSHALALALSPTEVKRSYSIPISDRLSRAYMAGETFPAEGEKGWYLICIDGYSCGWGKLAGGIMKNHYPKGLRKNL